MKAENPHMISAVLQKLLIASYEQLKLIWQTLNFAVDKKTPSVNKKKLNTIKNECQP